MPCWQGKIELSKALEAQIFCRRLKRHEIDRLKLRCERYQNQDPPRWDETIFLAYTMYFGCLTALKVKASLEELQHFGYLSKGPWTLLDYGAGTLGASLGAKDFFQEELTEIHATDLDPRPVEWAQREFRNFFGSTSFSRHGLRAGSRQIRVACDVLNEMSSEQSLALLQRWASELGPEDLILLIEPAAREPNQRLLNLRDRLRDRMSILLPCTHQELCPALAQDEWCHEDRPFRAPPDFFNLVRDLNFRRSSLTYSVLAIGRRDSVFAANQARVVSQNIRSKGREEKWLCAGGQRWKASVVSRKVSDETLAFAEATRGDIISLIPELAPPSQKSKGQKSPGARENHP